MTLHPVPKPVPRVKVRKPLKARRSMKRVGKRGALFPAVKNPAFRRWLRTQHPCMLANTYTTTRLTAFDSPNLDGSWVRVHVCWGPIDPAHVGTHQARGASDVGHCVPLCRAAHRFYDEHRGRWQEATGLTGSDMASRAGGYGLKWVERGGV